MGNKEVKAGKYGKLPDTVTIDKFHKFTHFSQDQIYDLLERFRRIANEKRLPGDDPGSEDNPEKLEQQALGESDALELDIKTFGGLDYDDFRRLFRLQDSKVAEQCFHLFDGNGDGLVDFRDFVVGMSICYGGNLEEKLNFCFSTWDSEGRGYITKEEMRQMIKYLVRMGDILIEDEGGNTQRVSLELARAGSTDFMPHSPPTGRSASKDNTESKSGKEKSGDVHDVLDSSRKQENGKKPVDEKEKSEHSKKDDISSSSHHHHRKRADEEREKDSISNRSIDDSKHHHSSSHHDREDGVVLRSKTSSRDLKSTSKSQVRHHDKEHSSDVESKTSPIRSTDQEPATPKHDDKDHELLHAPKRDKNHEHDSTSSSRRSDRRDSEQVEKKGDSDHDSAKHEKHTDHDTISPKRPEKKDNEDSVSSSSKRGEKKENEELTSSKRIERKATEDSVFNSKRGEKKDVELTSTPKGDEKKDSEELTSSKRIERKKTEEVTNSKRGEKKDSSEESVSPKRDEELTSSKRIEKKNTEESATSSRRGEKKDASEDTSSSKRDEELTSSKRIEKKSTEDASTSSRRGEKKDASDETLSPKRDEELTSSKRIEKKSTDDASTSSRRGEKKDASEDTSSSKRDEELASSKRIEKKSTEHGATSSRRGEKKDSEEATSSKRGEKKDAEEVTSSRRGEKKEHDDVASLPRGEKRDAESAEIVALTSGHSKHDVDPDDSTSSRRGEKRDPDDLRRTRDDISSSHRHHDDDISSSHRHHDDGHSHHSSSHHHHHHHHHHHSSHQLDKKDRDDASTSDSLHEIQQSHRSSSRHHHDREKSPKSDSNDESFVFRHSHPPFSSGHESLKTKEKKSDDDGNLGSDVQTPNDSPRSRKSGTTDDDDRSSLTDSEDDTEVKPEKRVERARTKDRAKNGLQKKRSQSRHMRSTVTNSEGDLHRHGSDSSFGRRNKSHNDLHEFEVRASRSNEGMLAHSKRHDREGSRRDRRGDANPLSRSGAISPPPDSMSRSSSRHGHTTPDDKALRATHTGSVETGHHHSRSDDTSNKNGLRHTESSIQLGQVVPYCEILHHAGFGANKIKDSPLWAKRESETTAEQVVIKANKRDFDDQVETFIEEIFETADPEHEGRISFEQFKKWASKTPLISHFLAHFDVMLIDVAEEAEELAYEDEERKKLDTSWHCPKVDPGLVAKMKLEDFKWLRLLGQGSYGDVWLVQYMDSSVLFAMKCIKKKRLVNDSMLAQARAEKKVLLKNTHPFIVHLYRTFRDDCYVYFLFEYVSGGELDIYFRANNRCFDVHTTRFYAAELISALEYLHAVCSTAHRDIKGHIRLADFGFAKFIGHEELTYTLVGTPEYIPPEILRGKGYSKSCDLWSFGITIYKMMLGHGTSSLLRPYYRNSRNEIFSAILEGKFEYPSHFDPVTRDLLKGLLNPNEKKRFTAAQAKAHPWFACINWQLLEREQVMPPFVPNAIDRLYDIKDVREPPEPVPESYKRLFTDF